MRRPTEALILILCCLCAACDSKPYYAELMPDDFKYLSLGMPARVFDIEYYPKGPFRSLKKSNTLKADVRDHRWFEAIYITFSPYHGLAKIELWYHRSSGDLSGEVMNDVRKMGMVNRRVEGLGGRWYTDPTVFVENADSSSYYIRITERSVLIALQDN